MLTVPPLLATMTMLALPLEQLMTMVNVQPLWPHVSNHQWTHVGALVRETWTVLTLVCAGECQESITVDH